MLLFGLFVGQTIGPVVWGYLGEQTNFAVPFAVSGIALLLLGAIAPPVLRRAGLPPEPPIEQPTDAHGEAGKPSSA